MIPSSLTCLGSILALIDMLIFLNRPSDLFTKSRLKDRLFGQYWLRMGKSFCADGAGGAKLRSGPMFAARDEETAVPKLVSQASGVVLELGPGLGSQLPRYDVSKLTKVYGVEPNAELHEAIRAKIKACRLDDIYEIVPCGIEDVATLKKHGISPSSIDTVLSMQVQCSVPDPDEILRRLYTLLKPGGQMLIYEHVESKDPVSRIVQSKFRASQRPAL